MTSTVGDYLFWRLASVGVRSVAGRSSSSLFLGSVQRNRLYYIDYTRSGIAPSSTEVGAFVAAPTAGEVSACYEESRRVFAWRPVIIIAELDSAQFVNVSEVTRNVNFAAATIINSPSTAASQINRTIDVMLYESKPVFIGLSLAVAGQIMSVPSTPSSSMTSRAASQYGSNGAAYSGSSADAAVAMSFIR